jgi:hypothetical protein
MVLRPLPPSISPLLSPACPSPTFIKGRAPTSGFTRPLPTSLLFSPRPSTAHTERLLRRFFPTDARLFSSLRRLLLQPVRLTAVPSPFFLNCGEVPCTGAPFRPFSGEPPPRPYPRSTVDWCRPRSTNSWTWSTGFPLEIQFLEIPISSILHLGPSTFSISTRSP